MSDKPLYELPDDVFVTEKELPDDLTISHTHFEGICTKMGHSKKEDKHYVMHSDFSNFCDEEPMEVLWRIKWVSEEEIKKEFPTLGELKQRIRLAEFLCEMPVVDLEKELAKRNAEKLRED